MYDNKKQTTLKRKAQLAVKAGSLHMPKKLKAQLIDFIQKNEKASSSRHYIFQLLDLAFQAEAIDYLTPAERANLFFTTRQLIALSDAVFMSKKSIFNH